MSDPKIENLPQAEQELTPEEAEEAQGGIMQSIEADRLMSSEEAFNAPRFVNAGGNF